jgi:MbtH protein
METEEAIFVVVINHEDQYSIWPAHRGIPQGWQTVGNPGGKPECLKYIDEHWTDLRPRSLREHLAASARH